MYRIEMPHIKRKWQGKYIYIPGGWRAHLPIIEVEPCVLEAWRVYLMQSGVGVIESVAQAKRIGQGIYAAGYRPGLLSHTMYWAKQYAKAYPESLEATGMIDGIYVLKGFEPERVQSSFVPFQRSGRKGQPFMSSLLREMRDES